jgi:hypothetical protein
VAFRLALILPVMPAVYRFSLSRYACHPTIGRELDAYA